MTIRRRSTLLGLLPTQLLRDFLLTVLPGAITDPGDAAAISVITSGQVALVTTGAETRTLAAPEFLGQELLLYLKTDGGDCVVTCSTGYDAAGSTTFTLADPGDYISLVAVESGADLRWRVDHVDGVAGHTFQGNVISEATPASGVTVDGVLLKDGSPRLGAIADPGNAAAIPVIQSGYVPLVTSSGNETRTLAAPSFIGQELTLYLKTNGGTDCKVTCSTTINEAGNNTILFNATGESLFLRAVEEGSNLRWRCAVADGATLSTV